MNPWLLAELAREHTQDLHREAARYRRIPARRDRAHRGFAQRLSSAFGGAAGAVGLRRGPAVVGCDV